MAYRKSQVDNSNFDWFTNDDSVASLHSINLKEGWSIPHKLVHV